MQEEAKGQPRPCSFGFHLRGCFKQQFQFQEVNMRLLSASGFTSQYLCIVKKMGTVIGSKLHGYTFSFSALQF